MMQRVFGHERMSRDRDRATRTAMQWLRALTSVGLTVWVVGAVWVLWRLLIVGRDLLSWLATALAGGR